MQRSDLLTFEEIERVTRIAVALGVEKVRLTGGEPTLRRDLPRLVSSLTLINGLREINLTTNGSRLVDIAGPLRDAGLTRVTVSLDSLDDTVFRAMNDVGFPVSRVLEGIETLQRVGFTNIKVNTVVKRGLNQESILPIATLFRGTGIVPRFIEFMDAGATNGWHRDHVVTAEEIVNLIDSRFPLEPLAGQYRDEVAERWRYADGGGEIGVIASVTRPFCGDCSRLRLSSDGRLFTCLFGTVSHDLRTPMREGATDSELADRMAAIWGLRADRYSERRQELVHGQPVQKAEMSYIGG
jgi:cyclic pyranopterin phosphate synthase